MAVEVHYCAHCKGPLTFDTNVLIVRCTYCGHISSKIQADIDLVLPEPEVVSAGEVEVSGSSSGFGILDVIIAIFMIALVSAVGLMVISTSSEVFGVLGNSTQDIAAYNQTVNSIYAAWPIMAVVVLGFMALLVIFVFAFR